MSGISDTLHPGGTNVPPPPSNATPPAPPATPPGQQTGVGQGQATTPPSTTGTAPGQQSGSAEGDDTIRVTKTDLDARIDKAKRSGQRELLEALGFANLDDPTKLTQAQTDLKNLIDFARQQQRAAMTAEQQVKADLEAAQTTAESERTQRAAVEQERDTARNELREYILRSTITQAAQGAAHPSDVYDLYARVHAKDKLAEVIKPDVALFGEDGAFNAEAINADAVKAIIDNCREERREWWQPAKWQPGSPSNAGAQPPASDLSKLEQQRQLARANLRSL